MRIFAWLNEASRAVQAEYIFIAILGFRFVFFLVSSPLFSYEWEKYGSSRMRLKMGVSATVVMAPGRRANRKFMVKSYVCTVTLNVVRTFFCCYFAQEELMIFNGGCVVIMDNMNVYFRDYLLCQVVKYVYIYIILVYPVQKTRGRLP